ncbi:MAG: hypothetical protein CVV27_14305, partial [Candidatus Melainabacteria bacterium HGW-Melainabacteria-1]
AGVFSTADGSEAGPRIINANGNTQAERDLRRLEDIDQSIQASLTRLDAALDPNNTDPANLEKLVVGDGVDPALLGSRSLRQQAEIDQKFDEKNQALIDNTMTGNLDNVESTGNPASGTLERNHQLQTEVDSKLDDKAKAVSPTDSNDVPNQDPEPVEPAPAPEQAPEQAPSDKPSF